MAEFFYNYGLFFAKTATIVLCIVLTLIVLVYFISKTKGKHREHIEIKKLNDKYDELHQSLLMETLSKDELKKVIKQEKIQAKEQNKRLAKGEQNRKKIFVLNFEGDIRASAVNTLREEITAILTMARNNIEVNNNAEVNNNVEANDDVSDEVFVKLESGGGMVHAYGLASSQLMRIRDKGIPLTVSVDKVAASGGYMMACVANKIICAPFAVLGSIGVLAQIPNFHRLLKKNNIDFEQITAGEYKRTITMFGENTEKDRAKLKEDLEDTHLLFKEFIEKNRPDLDIKAVATGEHWLGIRAQELKLVDELQTSDDYLLENSRNADIYELKFISKKALSSKVSSFVEQTAEKLFYSWWQHTEQNKYQ